MITTFCPKCHRPYDESLGECPVCSRKTAAEQNQAKARKKISLMGKRSHPAPKPPKQQPGDPQAAHHAAQEGRSRRHDDPGSPADLG